MAKLLGFSFLISSVLRDSAARSLAPRSLAARSLSRPSDHSLFIADHNLAPRSQSYPMVRSGLSPSKFLVSQGFLKETPARPRSASSERTTAGATSALDTPAAGLSSARTSRSFEEVLEKLEIADEEHRDAQTNAPLAPLAPSLRSRSSGGSAASAESRTQEQASGFQEFVLGGSEGSEYGEDRFAEHPDRELSRMYAFDMDQLGAQGAGNFFSGFCPCAASWGMGSTWAEVGDSLASSWQRAVGSLDCTSAANTSVGDCSSSSCTSCVDAPRPAWGRRLSM